MSVCFLEDTMDTANLVCVVLQVRIANTRSVHVTNLLGGIIKGTELQSLDIVDITHHDGTVTRTKYS